MKLTISVLSVATLLGATFLTTTVPVCAQVQDTPPPASPPSTPPTPPAPPPASSDEDNKQRFSVGPELGVYLPVNNKVRNTFGTAWYSFGVGFGPIKRPSDKGHFNADIRFLGASRGGGRDVMLIPLNLNYRRALQNRETGNDAAIPYAGAGLSLVGSQLHSDPDNIRSRFRFTYGANVFAGVQFHDKGYIQARYFQIAKTRGFDLSGLQVAAGYRF